MASRPPLSERDPDLWDLAVRLNDEFEAEDREIEACVAAEETEDRQRAAAGLLPVERPRDLQGFQWFANGRAEPRA